MKRQRYCSECDWSSEYDTKEPVGLEVSGYRFCPFCKGELLDRDAVLVDVGSSDLVQELIDRGVLEVLYVAMGEGVVYTLKIEDDEGVIHEVTTPFALYLCKD